MPTHKSSDYKLSAVKYDLYIDLSYSRYMWECNINFL